MPVKLSYNNDIATGVSNKVVKKKMNAKKALVSKKFTRIIPGLSQSIRETLAKSCDFFFTSLNTMFSQQTYCSTLVSLTETKSEHQWQVNL